MCLFWSASVLSSFIPGCTQQVTSWPLGLCWLRCGGCTTFFTILHPARWWVWRWSLCWKTGEGIEAISVAAVLSYDNHWHTWFSAPYGVISVGLCCMIQCLNGSYFTDLQKVKDWHLVIAVLGVTAVGVALLVARSALLPKQPKLIKDSENNEGRTVRKNDIL